MSESRVFDMFIGGATYRQISDRLDIPVDEVHQVIEAEMVDVAKRQKLLTDDGSSVVFRERIEAIFRAHYPAGLRGDAKSAEICRRMLLMTAPPAETAKQRRGLSLAKTAATKDRLTTLCVLRDRLAADLDAARDPREVAALALRLTEVLSEIDGMPRSEQVSAADEIAERRAARRGGRAANKARAPRSG